MKTLGQLRTWIEETYLCENIIFMYVSGIFEFLMVGNCAKFDINGSENENKNSVLCRFYNLCYCQS